MELLTGSTPGRQLRLRSGVMVVGKSGDAHVRLRESGVSRAHAQLEVGSDGAVTLTDLGSTNGTFVDGERISKSQLRAGARIQFGPDAKARLLYLEVDQATAASVLSARQLELARLVAEGKSNPEIAKALGISVRTVTSHLDHIYTRLNIRNRAALTRWVMDRGVE